MKKSIGLKCTRPDENLRSLKSDAHLIAAAPEMFEALKYLVSEIHQSGCAQYMNESSIFSSVFNRHLKIAEQAIAKAKGE